MLYSQTESISKRYNIIQINDKRFNIHCWCVNVADTDTYIFEYLLSLSNILPLPNQSLYHTLIINVNYPIYPSIVYCLKKSVVILVISHGINYDKFVMCGCIICQPWWCDNQCRLIAVSLISWTFFAHLFLEINTSSW